MTTIEHALPVPVLYEDILTLFSESGTGNTPTHIVNYGGMFGEVYVWVSLVEEHRQSTWTNPLCIGPRISIL